MGYSRLEDPVPFQEGQDSWADGSQSDRRLFVSENWEPQSHADKKNQLDIQRANLNDLTQSVV